MLKNWKTLALCSLLAATPLASPAVAQAGEKDKILEKLESMDKALGKAFAEFAKDIDKIKAEIKNLREVDLVNQRLEIAQDVTAKMKEVAREVADLRIAFNLLKSLPAGIDKVTIDDIRTKLAAIEQAIIKLGPTEKRLALSPPTQVGRVVLVNLYPEELLFIVNQKRYRVDPNATMTLDNIPAGVLSYEVLSATWGQRARSTTTLAANETFSLTAR
jgi:hypothetical protein